MKDLRHWDLTQDGRVAFLSVESYFDFPLKAKSNSDLNTILIHHLHHTPLSSSLLYCKQIFHPELNCDCNSIEKIPLVSMNFMSISEKPRVEPA